jgi:hypothetical protein
MHPDFVVCATWVISFLDSVVPCSDKVISTWGVSWRITCVLTVFLRDLSQSCLAVEEKVRSKSPYSAP